MMCCVGLHGTTTAADIPPDTVLLDTVLLDSMLLLYNKYTDGDIVDMHSPFNKASVGLRNYGCSA